MRSECWHATACLALCALVLLGCALHLPALAMTAFVFALWHASMVLWSLKPRHAYAWCFVVNGSRGRLQVSWMTV